MTQLLITYCSLFREGTATDISLKPNGVLPEFVSTEEPTEVFWADKEKTKGNKTERVRKIKKQRYETLATWIQLTFYFPLI